MFLEVQHPQLIHFHRLTLSAQNSLLFFLHERDQFQAHLIQYQIALVIEQPYHRAQRKHLKLLSS
jgi:hypothetical protein